MKSLPSITSKINENLIHKTITDNFAALAPAYYTLASNWFVRAYNHFKDIDKFVIIIYLINQDLIFFRQNAIKVDYETFYKDKAIEIDKINILNASLLAMKRAILNLPIKPALVLVDGIYKPDLNIPMKTIIGGDSIEDAISAASIIAKVYRDNLMIEYNKKYPDYNFKKNISECSIE